MVRCVRSGGQATCWPSCSESRASAASSGSTPITAASGHSARTAAATPEISPPPPTGTTTRSTPGQSAAISRPTVPWPGDHPPVVERRDGHRAALRGQVAGGGQPGGQAGRGDDDLRAQRADGGHLDRGGVVRDHHDRGHAEQRGRVRHGQAVVAAGVGDHAALPRGRGQRVHRRVGAAQLERAGRLQRLRLDQQSRVGAGERHQRGADGHARQGRRGGPDLVDRHERLHLHTLRPPGRIRTRLPASGADQPPRVSVPRGPRVSPFPARSP